MNTQPEALRIARTLEQNPNGRELDKAAAELRRLHSVNAELLGALEKLRDSSSAYWTEQEVEIINAAIARAEGEQK